MFMCFICFGGGGGEQAATGGLPGLLRQLCGVLRIMLYYTIVCYMISYHVML